MSKRDVLQEILTKRERLPFGQLRAASGLLQIRDRIDRDASDAMAVSLHVVGIVACVEVAARDAIRQLVDSGDPYDQRVGDLLKGDIRFTLDVVRAFRDRKVSLGEFVAHLLAISSIDQMFAYFDVLLDASFRQSLVDLATDEGEVNAEPAATPLVPDVDRMMRAMARAFAARHVTAHEADFAATSKDDVREFLAQAVLFESALYELVRQCVGPMVGPSALQDSLVAMQHANESADELLTTYKQLVQILRSGHLDTTRPDVLQALDASQKAFDKYLGEEVSFRLAFHNPGSGNSMRAIEAWVTGAFSRQRNEDLKEAVSTAIELIEVSKLRSGA